MTSLTNHLIRRGMEGLSSSIHRASESTTTYPHLSFWGFIALTVTLVVYAFGQVAISYTYGELIATLAAVEAPSSTAIVRTLPAESEDSSHPDAPLLSAAEKADAKEQQQQPQDQEILLIKQRALTSRFCTIRRHLKTHGGRGSRFRGFPIFLLIGILLIIIRGFASNFIHPDDPYFILVDILSYAALTPLELLWTHTIISTPSTKRWYQRIPSTAVSSKVLIPTIIYVAIVKITNQGFYQACLMLRIDPTTSIPTGHQPLTQTPASLIIVLFLGFFLFAAIQIPTEIAMIRVRASLLSTEETPIIPFDRSFNGQVIPEEQGGRGMLDLWQAWTGCDMQTRLRVLGVYAKVVAMQLTWTALAAAAFFVQMRFLFDQEFMNNLSLDLAVKA